MSIQQRAEQIAVTLVCSVTGARSEPLGPASPVDFRLTWLDGREGVLEATLVAHPDAIRWQNQIADHGGTWPHPGRWEFRLHTLAMLYRPTGQAMARVVALCDEHGVDSPEALPAEARADEAVGRIEAAGRLRRVRIGRDGVTVFVPTRAEFVDATDPDFAAQLEAWIRLAHVRAHIAKTRTAAQGERHLFLVPLDDVLPSRFFTDDFTAPERFPAGYEGVDGLWIWSNYWHRVMGWYNGAWEWHDTPTGR